MVKTPFVILSPTQIDVFRTCRRKWAYRYLDKIKTPPSKAALLGIKVHECLQTYLTSYQIDYGTTEGRVASPGLGYLPKNIPPENIEKHICFAKSGILFQGYVDFYQNLGSQTWLIGDHKTCSSFKTALTPEQLKHGVQANVYAQWAFQELGAETVKLKWIYYRTKGLAKAQCVEAEIKKEEQPSLFWPQLQIASSIMATLQAKPDSLDLPKNLNACFKYGRCPFYNSCRADQKPAAANPIGVKKVQTSSAYVSSFATDKGKDEKNSFHLFVDCAPIKTDSPYKNTLELSELLKPVLKRISEEKNIAHYRLMGYGQHVGVMAHYLEEYLKENNLGNHVAILSSSKTPEGIDTLQTLSAAASQVIRGF